MTTWTTIFPDVDGSPVRGEPSEFRTTANFFRDLSDQTRSIVDEFARFADDGQASGSLEGETANAFGRFIEEVDESLSELPEVSGQAAEIFDEHVEELSRLREWAEIGTDSALARARTAWNTKNDLEDDAARLRRSHEAIMRQIDSVEASDDGTGSSDPERSNLDDARGRNADSLRLTEEGVAEQARILAGIRGEWDDIRAAERRLDDQTVDDLDGIRLGDLEDPGFWDKIVSGAFDLLITLGTIAVGVMCPLLALYLMYDGDWAAMLWDLKEILDVVLVVAGVVALFFPLTAPFVIAIAALSVLALTVNATLYATQAPNPQTGETVGLGDVLWSAAGVAFSGANSLKALRALRGTGTFTPMSGITSFRTNVGNWRSVLTSGENATGAARDLGIRMVPLAPGTGPLAGLGYVAQSQGGPLAIARTAHTVRGHVRRPGQVIGLPDSTSAAVGLNPIQGPNPDVFTGIADRERFNQPWHWNNGILPGGHELHIVPAH
ncbi:MAG TPA: hypothetical protein VNO51_18480 [Ilumatobacteraceae bacterium]|nr:hypothetical protein [Ilumatobacteraceae bacterium]